MTFDNERAKEFINKGRTDKQRERRTQYVRFVNENERRWKTLGQARSESLDHLNQIISNELGFRYHVWWINSVPEFFTIDAKLKDENWIQMKRQQRDA